MMKATGLDRFTLKEWTDFSSEDREAMDWIWNQLMGETAKGDSLNFVTINRGRDECVYAGVLKAADGRVKGIVPAMYERFDNGILETVDFKDQCRRDDTEAPIVSVQYHQSTEHVDNLAKEFLSSDTMLTKRLF